jgi:hypothetical protein
MHVVCEGLPSAGFLAVARFPLVIRGSCRAPRLTMGAPKARNRDDADRLPVVVAAADRILHTPNTDYRALAQQPTTSRRP